MGSADGAPSQEGRGGAAVVAPVYSWAPLQIGPEYVILIGWALRKGLMDCLGVFSSGSHE